MPTIEKTVCIDDFEDNIQKIETLVNSCKDIAICFDPCTEN